MSNLEALLRYKLAPVFSLLLLLTACMGKEESTKEGNTPNSNAFKITVDAEPVVQEQVSVSIEAVGSIEAAEDVLIAAETAGLVKKILFEEGMPVGKGKVLLQLDDEMARLEQNLAEKRLQRLKAGLIRAEAEVRRQEALAKNAESTYERKKSLLDQGATTQAVYQDALAEFAAAEAGFDEAKAALEESRRMIQESEASLKIAEERVKDCTILAPINGILGERFVGPGDYVDVAGGLVRLVAVDPLKVNFTVPERYRANLRLEQEVLLSVEAYPEDTFRGKVVFISPSLDLQTRSVLVKAEVVNSGEKLRPGFFCHVQLVISTHAEALVIPEESIIPRGDDFFVYAVEDGKAVKKQVVLGQRMPGRVEILEGLSPGATVITAGHQRVTHDCPVRIRDRKADSERSQVEG
jgi:membrane fusion protein (multidrug efflux system)